MSGILSTINEESVYHRIVELVTFNPFDCRDVKMRVFRHHQPSADCAQITRKHHIPSQIVKPDFHLVITIKATPVVGVFFGENLHDIGIKVAPRPLTDIFEGIRRSKSLTIDIRVDKFIVYVGYGDNSRTKGKLPPGVPAHGARRQDGSPVTAIAVFTQKLLV